MTDAPISPARKWAITISVMLVTFMQVLDTSVTNVVLPHMQGSLSAGVEEIAWVLTSYLAANAIVLPATGWLAGWSRSKAPPAERWSLPTPAAPAICARATSSPVA